ncbi:glycosyltransferase family 4 protein [Arthrobacter sp. DNA4]|uniref:glycosyltransferase family 4 protein n=1 Tax=Arthrobacter sp. DNA4 TaxID=2963432 RepID=UPI00350E386F
MNNPEHERPMRPPLRIALVHSFYSSRNPSGENSAVMQQAEAMRRAGYIVEVFGQRTDERELSRLYPLEAALTVATGRGPKPDMREFEPDLIHIHNLFPNYGKSWIQSSPVPVVTSIHNYRPLCAAGTFYRDGRVCTDCSDGGSSVPALMHGCYRGRAQTVPVAIGQRFGADAGLRHSDAVIVLSDQMRAMYAQSGLPWGKMHTIPNFLPKSLDSGVGAGEGRFWLYAGRLSEEKGILELLRRWPAESKLVLVGSGELEPQVRALANENVSILGPVDRTRLMALMRDATGVVFPSRCFEGFPLIYPEALSAGTPILTWAPNVVSTLVRAEGTGLVGGSEDMEDLVRVAGDLFPTLRSHCRSIYDSKYSEEKWLLTIDAVYRSVLQISNIA